MHDYATYWCFEMVCGTCVEFRASEVLVNHVLESIQGAWLDVQLTIKILAYLLLHLIDLSELELAPVDDGPGFI
jgi:hypothetical protein